MSIRPIQGLLDHSREPGKLMVISMRVIDVHGMIPNDPSVVYVGRACSGWRGGVLGNPCSIPNRYCPVCGEVHFSRDRRGIQVTPGRSLPCYRRWLWRGMRDGVLLPALRVIPADAALGCWCVTKDRLPDPPEVCHAEVIAAAWRWLQGQEPPQPSGSEPPINC